MTQPIVRMESVDIVFGDKPDRAFPLIDEGLGREEIREQTGLILGVAGATLDVQEGETIVLMGLSGSGKSSLLRAVNGLNPVVRGTVEVLAGDNYVNPTRCTSSDLRDLRMHHVAMVFQHFGLLPWRTVADNVGYGLEIAGIGRSERTRRVSDQLNNVGLNGWEDCKLEELSGGMQQRVGLARAFVTDAPILLMDEPFSALDPLIRSNLQDDLIDLRHRLKRTIIFVSHDLDEAMKIGSRIAIMEGGRIVQIGTPQDIALNPSTDYVADFVAHMNPLNVLRAGEVMKPVDMVPAPVGGFPVGDLIKAEKPPDEITITADPETPIRDLIEAHRIRPDPIHIIADGQQVGVVGGDDLFRALTR